MSYTVPSGLLTHMQGAARTLAWACKITRTDSTVLAVTTHDADLVIGGVTYQAAPGLDVRGLVSTAGFAVDNTEATILADGLNITKADVLAGRWDGAAVELMRVNPADTSAVFLRLVGTFGNVKPGAGQFTVEIRGLRQSLQQSVVPVTQATCRNRLGDAKCGVNMATAGRTVTGTLTSVTSQQVVRDSGRAEAADFFTAGEITMTSGDAAGLTFKVKAHAADGTMTLALPSVLPLAIGNTYSLRAGCRKRLTEDCIAKFSNALNFNGEPHLPGQDRIVSGT